LDNKSQSALVLLVHLTYVFDDTSDRAKSQVYLCPDRLLFAISRYTQKIVCIIFFSHGRNGLEELQLSEAGLKALGQCGTLGSVNAGQAHGVTDAVVSALCEGNLSLKSLV